MSSRGLLAILLYSFLFFLLFPFLSRFLCHPLIYFSLAQRGVSGDRSGGTGARQTASSRGHVRGRRKQKGGTFDVPICSLTGSRAAPCLLAPALDR
ncbi:hypothetical protein B0T11DRAFT_113054 [Plectosphaerella cucumerina]|uniref:Uncharacterized protein n=1 Tax=Plectosphaerella cucumerina TaxID=40658 RepID=A0A8K0X1Z0_9PEZI|nr:hypothetical protein B0T11DRAFT_113054 [Plectosphaerella cucumerina]